MSITMQTLTPQLNATLSPLEKTQTIPAGKLLFREGEMPRGIYYLHDGEIDLVFSSRTGGSKPLRVAAAGQLLGLSCVLSERAHDCSATTKSAAVIGFIDRDEFRHLLQERPDLWIPVLQMISEDVNACWDCMRSLTKC